MALIVTWYSVKSACSIISFNPANLAACIVIIKVIRDQYVAFSVARDQTRWIDEANLIPRPFNSIPFIHVTKLLSVIIGEQSCSTLLLDLSAVYYYMVT